MKDENRITRSDKNVSYLQELFTLCDTDFFTYNRALRHGLLAMILNVSLSAEDAQSFMTEKEKQILKLKKVVGKGLPNHHTKTDDLINSLAGKQEEISTIRRDIIKSAQIIKVMYDIIKAQEKENKTIENYLNEKLQVDGEKEQIEEKIRRSRFGPDADAA